MPPFVVASVLSVYVHVRVYVCVCVCMCVCAYVLSHVATEPPCGANEEYSDCGKPCQGTCANPVPGCMQPCVKGCFCQAGYLRLAEGDRCVEASSERCLGMHMQL